MIQRYHACMLLPPTHAIIYEFPPDTMNLYNVPHELHIYSILDSCALILHNKRVHCTFSLIAGFGACAWFLSMWMSNTATITLILPIVEAVVQQVHDLEMTKQDFQALEHLMKDQESAEIENHMIQKGKESDGLRDIEVEDGRVVLKDDKSASRQKNEDRMSKNVVALAKAMTLCVGYNSKIGGMAMLTGTPINLLVKSFMDE